MLERLSKTKRNIGLGVIAALLLWFGWTVRAVLNPLILGYLLAYILRPLVQLLQNRGVGRRAAVNVIFSLFGLALLIIGGGLVVQGKELVTNLIASSQKADDPFTRAEHRVDAILEDLGSWFDRMFRSDDSETDTETDSETDSETGAEGAATPGGDAAPEGAEPGASASDSPEGGAGDGGPEEGDPAGGDPVNGAPMEGDPSEPAAETTGPDGDVEHATLTLRNLVRAWVKDWQSASGEGSGFSRAQAVLGYVQRIFGGVVSVLGFLILLPVYTYFLLFELERIHAFLRNHVPKRERERVTRIGRQVGAVIANFFRGRLLICVLKGLVLATGLSILQVPYGFLLGMFSGFLALVPFVGPVIGFGISLLISFQGEPLLEGAFWTTPAIWVGPLFLLGEFLEGYIFIPKILGDSLGLHPVVILMSVFVGGAALGLFGFLIAIPLAATLIILFRELVMPAIEDFAEEDSHVDEKAAAG